MERREFLDRREFVTATGGLGLASLLGTGTAAGAEEASYVREEHRIESFDGVEIPAVLFVPEDGADAAVLATHGWAGSKASVEDYGPLFTAHGYAVLAFDQRGFGESTAEVGLSGPNDVHDVSALIDFLAADDRIETDPDGDPKVGMIGRSYAGGIQMNAAAVDDRIDALVPFIPWHDLSFSLAPNGVPKLGWTTFLYGLGVAGSRLGSANTDALDGGGPPVRPETFGDVENLEQGVTPRLHELYAKAIVENRIPEEGRAYLKSRSTVSKADRVDTPTLVCQGWPDTLFTPNEGHRIVEDVGADGTPTRLALYNGGHTLNGSISPTAQVEYLESLALTWFERHLRGGNVDVPELTFWDVDRGEFRTADGFPPTDAETVEFSLADLEGDDANAGVGDVSSLFDVPVPGLGVATEPVGGVLDDTLSGLTGGLGGDDASSTLSVGADQSLVANTVAPTSASQILPVNGDLLPLSVAEFELPVEEPFEVLGTPTLSLSVTPLGTRTFCFGKVYRVRDGEAELLNNQAAPVAIEGTPGVSQRVEFELVAFQREFRPGDTLRVAVASTDAGFTSARQSAGFVVDHGASSLSLPVRETDHENGDGDNGGGDDGGEGDDGNEAPSGGPTATVEGPGNFALADSLELVDVSVAGGPAFVRDVVPAGWTVETAAHPYDRTAPPETEANYVEFTGATTDGTRSYLARPPAAADQSSVYTFGPVEVRTPGGEWEPVAGTERRVLLVGTEL